MEGAQTIGELLELEEADDGSFRAPPLGIEHGAHVFGGHIAAQALAAAARTVAPDRQAHSLHAYFVRGGTAGRPVRLDVDAIRDGRSFSVRQVTASQSGDRILLLQASFHAEEPGATWPGRPAPDVAGPEACTGQRTYLDDLGWLDVFEIRSTTPRPDRYSKHPLWIRARHDLPDDPAVHLAVLASVVDVGTASSLIADPGYEGRTGPTLDHCVWFHHPARLDDWVLVSVEPTVNAAARGLGIGAVHDRDGVLVATFSQEVLLSARARPKPAISPPAG